MSADLVLRRAEVADAREIGELHLRTWWWAYREIVPHEKLAEHDPDEREVVWEEALTQGRVAWVEEIGGRIAGFITLEAPKLRAIYVDPTAQGAGVGSRLLAFAERQFAEAGIAEAELTCLEGNGHARAFYEARGWTTDGVPFEGSWGPEVRYTKRLSS